MDQTRACSKSFFLAVKPVTPVYYSFLPARASEQGNVIGSVRIYIYIYIYVCTKKIVIE